MASRGWSEIAETDVRKKATLIKIKTSKKKHFVLREESSTGPARLEYYDSEKKFKSGVGQPKRCIVLKNCLSINGKTDSRHRHAIFLYTKDDCFGVAFENEATQQEWLTVMLDLRSRVQEDSTLTKPLFEHIWPVNLKSKGLGSRANLPTGPYHLCLTNTEISLIRLNHDDPPIVLPLDCIRRCGHSHEFFFIELGRSALTGAGELWLHVEDTVISQNMHEAILKAMTSIKPVEVEPYRARTRSDATKINKIHSKRPSVNGVPSTNAGGMPKRSGSLSVHSDQPSPSLSRLSATSTSINAPFNLPNSTAASSEFGRLDSNASSNEEPDAGYPSSGSTRSMTPDDTIAEEPAYYSMNPQQHDLNVSRPSPVGANDYFLKSSPSNAASFLSEYMPMPGGGIGGGGTGTGTGTVTASSSFRSKSSLSEADAQQGDRKSSSGRSSTYYLRGTSSALTPSPSSSTSEYMEMSGASQPAAPPTAKNPVEMRKSAEPTMTGAGRRSTGPFRSSATAGGSNCVNTKTSTEEGYMDMKVGFHPETVSATEDAATHGSSGSMSSVVSATSGTVSSIMSSRSGVATIEHERGFHSLSRLPEMSDGYMEMSPPRSSAGITRNSANMRLDVVYSYLRDEKSGKTSTDATGSEEFPKRAYSVGSKPEPGISGKPLTGGSYVDMSGTCSAVIAGLRRSQKETEKSCSAPHLNDEAGATGSSNAPAGTAATAAEVGDLFMELDFNRKTEHHVAKDFRDRASSGGSKDLTRCSRTLSCTAKDALSRITFFRPVSSFSGGLSMDPSERRPRTSTICQESLRPRTSSFGANVDDSRPRSSSGGNARLRDVFGPEMLLGSHRKSTLSAAKPQFSVESSIDSLNAGADYTDMFPGGVSSSSTSYRVHSAARSGPDTDEYMSMRPGDTNVASVSDYVPMRPGEAVVASTSSAVVSEYMMMGPGTAAITRKDSSKPPSEVAPPKANDVATGGAGVSDYMSMRPGEITAPFASNVSDYMPMKPSAAAARKEPSHKRTASDASSPQLTTACLTAPSAPTVRKLSGSGSSDHPATVKDDPVIRMPFELEASLSTLHYAAPDPAAGAATSPPPTAAAVPSSLTLTRTDDSSSPYFMMGGSSETSYTSLNRDRSRPTSEVPNSRTSSSSVSRGGPDALRCSHVYAEINFASK